MDTGFKMEKNTDQDIFYVRVQHAEHCSYIRLDLPVYRRTDLL